MGAGGLVFSAVVLLGFVCPPTIMPLVAVIAVVSWIVAGIGFLGHFRWIMKQGREGKVGFDD